MGVIKDSNFLEYCAHLVYTNKKSQSFLTGFYFRKLLKISSLNCVGVAGFEPATPCSQSRCANRAALHPEWCIFIFDTTQKYVSILGRISEYLLSNSRTKLAVRGGFEPPVRLLVRQFSKLVD